MKPGPPISLWAVRGRGQGSGVRRATSRSVVPSWLEPEGCRSFSCPCVRPVLSGGALRLHLSGQAPLFHSAAAPGRCWVCRRWESEARRRQGPSREAAREGLALGVSPASVPLGWSPAHARLGSGLSSPAHCSPPPPGSTGLGTGSGIPHYLRPFPASSAGRRAAPVFHWPHLE